MTTKTPSIEFASSTARVISRLLILVSREGYSERVSVTVWANGPSSRQHPEAVRARTFLEGRGYVFSENGDIVCEGE